MMDTVVLETPSKAPYTNLIARTLPKLEKKAVRVGRDYSQVIDCRYFDVPVLFHVGNRYDPKRGDKFEFIGAGGLTLREMVGFLREILLLDAEDCGVMRLDTTADLEGNWVPWCRENVRVRCKQRVQHESPSKTFRDVSQRCFETVYWGSRRGQNTAYDKTGERRDSLQKERRKMTREEREAISLEAQFEREYGYSIFTPITRFERRMTAREAGKAYGIHKLGEIKKALFIDPFEHWQFPERVHARAPGRIPRGLDEFTIRYLQGYVAEHGLTNARNEMMRVWGQGSAFYRKYQAIAPLLILPEKGVTGEQVRKAYLESTLKQIAA